MSAVVRPLLSPAAFVGPLGRIVATIAPHSEGDPAGILSALLAGFSALIGNGPTVKVGNRAQTLLFWPVLVGNTSTGRKGTATSDALSVISTAFPEFMEANTLGEPQSGAALISDMAGKAGVASGYPFLMWSEEFAQLLDASKRYKTLGKAFREAWQGNTLTNVTKTDGEIKVSNSHLVIIGNITPAEFLATVGKTDKAGGTMNRFLPVYVAQSKELPLGGNLSRAERASMAQLVHRAVMNARGADQIIMTTEAEDAWVSRYYSEIRTLTTGSEEIEQFAGRAHPYALRLAALYALADCRDEISVTDLGAAVAMVSYMAETVTFLSPKATNDASLSGQVETFIRQAGETGLRATEIYRRFGIKRAELEDIVTGLDTIEVTVGRSTGGRPPVVYRYVQPEAIDQAQNADDVPATAVRENGDVLTLRPVPTTAPDDPEPTDPAPLMAAPDVPSAVRDLRALITASAEPAPSSEPEHLPVFGVDALRALMDQATITQTPEPASVEVTNEDEDLSDLFESCTFAKVA